MSRTHNGIALVSRGAVALWVWAALAWYGAAAPLAPVLEPLPESAARIQPRPETPPPQAPPPPPPKQAAAAKPVPKPVAVSQAELSEGARLLDAGGGFPALSCGYSDFPSFGAYARAMAVIGARFVVVQNRQIVAGIDPASGRIDEDVPLVGFSPRARDYTGEAGLAPLARAARERFGSGAVVMMLVPREIDAGLFGGIAQSLAKRGEAHGDYREIHGRYLRSPKGGVRLQVESATRRDGTRLELPLLFELGALAGADASA